jgi:hypothetical protein
LPVYQSKEDKEENANKEGEERRILVTDEGDRPRGAYAAL